MENKRAVDTVDTSVYAKHIAAIWIMAALDNHTRVEGQMLSNK